MLNPKIVELYGEGSRKPLENLINLLGDKASAVYIVGHCGCRYVNGVKMPNVVTTEQSQVSFVEQCVHKLYDDWGGGADDETIEVWSETEKKGNIPLCVAVDEVQTAEKVTSGLFNAAALMGGD